MLAQNDDRNELIAMLAWQLDMGIDEALLDHPKLMRCHCGLISFWPLPHRLVNTGVSQTVDGRCCAAPVRRGKNAPIQLRLIRAWSIQLQTLSSG